MLVEESLIKANQPNITTLNNTDKAVNHDVIFLQRKKERTVETLNTKFPEKKKPLG